MGGERGKWDDANAGGGEDVIDESLVRRGAGGVHQSFYQLNNFIDNRNRCVNSEYDILLEGQGRQWIWLFSLVFGMVFYYCCCYGRF